MDEEEARRQKRTREQDELGTAHRATLLHLEYFDTRGIEDTLPLVEGVLTLDEMYKAKIVPLKNGGEEAPAIFGVTIDTPQSKIQEITKRYSERAESAQFVLISNSGYRAFMNRYNPPKEVVYDDVKIASEGDSATLESVSKNLDEVLPDDVLDYIVDQADRLGASDIHFENQRENVRIRMRIDGTLHPIAHLTKDKYRILMAIIASRSNLSSADENAQSGHILMDIPAQDGAPEHSLNMRVETVPTNFGMDAVLRLFNFDTEMLQLDVLGISDEEKSTLQEIISHPRGMVLTVGPTGSGKSTTLYSILNALNDTSRKILTLEDPVEYSLPGVSQIPVNTDKGHSFADELRAVLRLDPDIIMVGEIRDNDTARTAIQASITGHLVLATFHANSASTAFARLVDMIGVNPIFATAVRLVIGQRLVRRLDDETKQEYEPDDATKNWIRDVLADLPEQEPKPDLDNIKLWKPGQSDANPFGFNGRLVLMEQMVVEENVQAFLRGTIEDVNSSEIEKAARKNGMVTMLQRGVLSALEGKTTIEEVNKVL
ncbi:MAG: GspE/PulE family protein [Candidatus Nomurabacteria bacterium]|jgi:type II secretory ATPase GspE/PulE/Tfp pilus assembly ATPase PilB-like protein|nr:GspE/PulE family protein [Candidatus Nomurabacteria bacterium]